MAKKTSPLLPATDELIKILGERLRLARLRRKLTAKQVAERSGMSPMTLRNIEKGESGVTIGAYIAVMQVLGIEKDFNYLAQKDELGRELQDSQLLGQGKWVGRASSGSILSQGSAIKDKSIATSALKQTNDIRSTSKRELGSHVKLNNSTVNNQNWASEGGFKSSSNLADLIVTRPISKKI